MKKFAEEREINFPYLFDETRDVTKACGATCTPCPFCSTAKRNSCIMEGYSWKDISWKDK